MRRPFFSVIVIVMASLCGASSSWAETEWEVLKTLQLKTRPVDVMIAENNRWLYVLDDRHQLLIYDLGGQLKDAIDVGGEVDQIKAGPRDDLLFLLSRQAGTVQIVSVNVIESIDVQGAPFKGPADAVVTLAVFSDFQ